MDNDSKLWAARQAIRLADWLIVWLIAIRQKAAGIAGRAKRSSGRPVEDTGQERRRILSVAQMAGWAGYPPGRAADIFRRVIQHCKRIQQINLHQKPPAQNDNTERP